MSKAIVLAAGKGTRLQTEGITLPKVMREANGKPLLHYVLQNLSFLKQEDIVLVVGYHREDVLKVYGAYPHAVQEPQLGTGHAVAVARDYFVDYDGPVLICYGDMPLLRRSTYENLLAAHQEQGNACKASDTRHGAYDQAQDRAQKSRAYIFQSTSYCKAVQ